MAPAGLAAATPFGPTETAATSADADALRSAATADTELVSFVLLLVADDVAEAAAGPGPCWASVMACDVVTAAGGFWSRRWFRATDRLPRSLTSRWPGGTRSCPEWRAS